MAQSPSFRVFHANPESGPPALFPSDSPLLAVSLRVNEILYERDRQPTAAELAAAGIDVDHWLGLLSRLPQ